MLNLKTITQTLMVALVFASCTKVANDDISFIKTATPPSNLAADVVVTKAGIATITPTATGVASFSVYFGDNTATATVLPGKNATHTYAEGTFTIKVVAKNLVGDSAVVSKTITVTTSELLVDFDNAATTYGASGFGGAAFAKVSNPSATGINTSANVGKITKGSAGASSETWGGISINTSGRFTFASKGIMKMKVYSNHAGANILFKLEGPSTGATVETAVLTTVANGWEELTFVMDPSVVGRSFGGFSIFYEFGKAGNGSADYIGYFDDIKIFP
jgi:hypothetical protein